MITFQKFPKNVNITYFSCVALYTSHGKNQHQSLRKKQTYSRSFQQVHALETAAIKPDPFNQYVSAGVVSGIATVSIGERKYKIPK